MVDGTSYSRFDSYTPHLNEHLLLVISENKKEKESDTKKLDLYYLITSMNYTEIEIEWMKELLKENEIEIARLRKENKNLKLTIEQMENTCKDYLQDRDTLREENRKLKEERDMLVLQQMWAVDHLDLLEKENKKLKDKIAKLEFDIKAWVKLKSVREEKIRFLEQCLDNKEKVNKQLREDIGKLVMNNPS